MQKFELNNKNVYAIKLNLINLKWAPLKEAWGLLQKRKPNVHNNYWTLSVPDFGGFTINPEDSFFWENVYEIKELNSILSIDDMIKEKGIPSKEELLNMISNVENENVDLNEFDGEVTVELINKIRKTYIRSQLLIQHLKSILEFMQDPNSSDSSEIETKESDVNNELKKILDTRYPLSSTSVHIVDFSDMASIKTDTPI